MIEQEATSGVEEAMDAPKDETTTSQQSDNLEFEYTRDNEETEEASDGEEETEEVVDDEEVERADEEVDGEDIDTDEETTDDVETETEADTETEETTDEGTEKPKDDLQARFDALEEKNNKLLEYVEGQQKTAEGEKKQAGRSDTQIILDTDESLIPELMGKALGDRAAESNLSPVDIKMIATLIEQRAAGIDKMLEPMSGTRNAKKEVATEFNKLVSETDGDIYNYNSRIQQQIWKKYKGSKPESFNEVKEYRDMYQEMKKAEKVNRAKQYAKSKNVDAQRKSAAPLKTKKTKAPVKATKSYLEEIFDN